MKDLKGKVAVITGAASGIGFGLAERAATEGMKVVLADVEDSALTAAEGRLREAGADVLAVRTDVARLAEVEALRDRTLERFGAVHLLCNNAGVNVSGLSWELTDDDWTWVVGVNLWGVVHGVRAFVPAMLEHGDEGHVVNTASMAGLLAAAGMGPYAASKHAVVALTESLYHEFLLIGARLRASVLCPGWINTRIADADRNRPASLAATAQHSNLPNVEAMEQLGRQMLASGMSPAECADWVFRAVREERFWVLTHPDWAALVTARYATIPEGRNPEMRTPV